MADDGVHVPLKWGDAAHLEPIYCDHLHMGRVGRDLFYLTFAQARPPVAVQGKLPDGKPPTLVEI